MRHRICSSLMALALATVMAGTLGSCQRELAVTGDPRSEGIVPHPFPAVDMSILGDVKGGSTGGGDVKPKPAPEGETYAIKLTRPDVVGMTYDTQITAQSSNKAKATPPDGGEPQTKEDIVNVEIAGRVNVIAVDAKGQVSEQTIKLTKCTLDGKEILPADSVVNMKRGDKETVYTLAAGAALDDTAKKAMKMALNVDGTEEDNDLVFGSKTARKVGEIWSINSEEVVKSIANATAGEDVTVKVDPKNITGQCIIKGVETVGGVKALRFEANVEFKNALIGVPGVTTTPSDGKLTVGGLFPMDVNMQPLELSEIFTMGLHVTAPVKIEGSFDGTKKTVITAVAPATAPATGAVTIEATPGGTTPATTPATTPTTKAD